MLSADENANSQARGVSDAEALPVRELSQDMQQEQHAKTDVSSMPEQQASLEEDLSDEADIAALEEAADNYPMREMRIQMPFHGYVVCNPVTAFLAIATIWGLAIWCMADPETSLAKLTEGKAWTTKYFTWLFIGTTPAFMIFLLYVYVVYGDQKLGKKHDQPEFSAASYFAMIFSAGVAVGLFYYGVSEPLWHLSSHRFDTGYKSQDEMDMYAINLTVFHWGLSAWTSYVLVGVTAGIAAYRDGLPMTMRSCFYPLLGDYTWGFWGDLIDAFSIVVVISGVCTSLGLGSIQIVQGLQTVNAIDEGQTEDQLNDSRIIAIWVVTLVATISVVSGLNFGIKTLSQLAFLSGLALWFMVLVLDETQYLLNLIVAEVGYYFQWSVLQLNFETDAFGQLTPGEGRAVDGRGAASWWQNSWTIFYWAWWTAWSSFVGLFIARVSKGRTIREVVHFTLAGPLVYTFLWFCVFGGAGLRMNRRAMEVRDLGEAQFNDALYYAVPGSEFCFDPPSGPISVTTNAVTGNYTYVNEADGVGPVCMFNADDADASWFQVLSQYYDFGPFLCWLSLFAIAIYFVTSSDSGSLVVDHLASNGREDHHWLQRVFWAFTEGALATALLVAGGKDALAALQAASIIAGLPFTALLCIMCTCLYRALSDNAHPERFRAANAFSMPVYGGMWNLFDAALSFGGTFTHPERDAVIKMPSGEMVTEFFRGLLAPFWSLFIVVSSLHSKSKHRTGNMALSVVLGVCFVLWISLFISAVEEPGVWGFGWLFYFSFALIITGTRYQCRRKYNIRGNIFEDFFASLFLYAQVLSQMVIHINGGAHDVENDNGSGSGSSSDVNAPKDVTV